VLTISLHESGRFLFPGTGRSADIGGPERARQRGEPPARAGDDGSIWLDVFDHAVDPLIRAFDPTSW
jgi:acetoin utilization protein AcuC